MAKGDQSDTRNLTTGQLNAENSTANAQYGNLASQTAAAGTAGQGERANVISNYNNLAATGDITAQDTANLNAAAGDTGPAGSSAGGGSTGISYSGPSGSVGSGGTPATASTYAGGGGTATDYSGPSGSSFSYLNAPNYAQPMAGYQNLAATGGVDLSTPISTYNNLQANPEAAEGGNIQSAATALGTGTNLAGQNIYGNVDSSIGNLNNLAATGGVTQAQLDQLNQPLFQQFEQTGGYTPEQIAQIQQQGNSTISGYYSSLQDQLARQQATSGYGPGFSAANAALIQQGGVQAGQQDVNTNINIANAVRQGQMSAAQQISANALGEMQIQDPAKIQAATAAGNLGLGEATSEQTGVNEAGQLDLSNQSLINQTQEAAAAGDVNAQALIQAGEIAGLGGETNIQTQQFQNAATTAAGQQQYSLTEDEIAAQQAAASGQLGLGYASLNSANQRYLIGATQQGQETGAAGLLNTYNSQYAPLTQSETAQQNALNGQNNAAASYLGILNSNAAQPGNDQQAFNNIMSAVGTTAGGISGLGGITGGGSTSPNVYDPSSVVPGGGVGSIANYGTSIDPATGLPYDQEQF